MQKHEEKQRSEVEVSLHTNNNLLLVYSFCPPLTKSDTHVAGAQAGANASRDLAAKYSTKKSC